MPGFMFLVIMEQLQEQKVHKMHSNWFMERRISLVEDLAVGTQKYR